MRQFLALFALLRQVDSDTELVQREGCARQAHQLRVAPCCIDALFAWQEWATGEEEYM